MLEICINKKMLYFNDPLYLKKFLKKKGKVFTLGLKNSDPFDNFLAFFKKTTLL